MSKTKRQKVTISKYEWKAFCEAVYGDTEFSELLPMTFTAREVVLEATRVLNTFRGGKGT